MHFKATFTELGDFAGRPYTGLQTPIAIFKGEGLLLRRENVKKGRTEEEKRREGKERRGWEGTHCIFHKWDTGR